MSEIAQKASFEAIRYAQVWEDADVLVSALSDRRGGRFASIASGGDNALALLTLDPSEVVAVDFSPAQIACLEARRHAYARLPHDRLLELVGSRPSRRRGALLDEALAGADAGLRAFWEARRGEVEAHGLGGVGKFERYFRIFRERLLPLTHSRREIEAVFEPRSESERAEFLERVWNNTRWRLLLKLFFSRRVMGWLGRDPAFFDHVEGSVSEHVAERIRQAFVSQDPAQNPYLAWLLLGHHPTALPLALRPDAVEIIRARLDRITTRVGPIGAPEDGRFDGFNLSDIFEYMSLAETERVYGALLDAANPGARLAYWNMMAPRTRPEALAARARPLPELSDALHRADKAFFYAAFRVDEALP